VRVAKWLLALLIVLGLASVVFFRLEFRRPLTALASPAQPDGVQPGVRSNGNVGCLGSIEPRDGVTLLSAPYVQGRAQRVLELEVAAGDRVRRGQLLAILDGRDQLESAARVASAQVELARARFNKVKAGASEADIDAQKAVVAEIQAALDDARSAYHRFEVLHRQTDVSAAELDARRVVVATDEQKLKAAQDQLNAISEVRPEDLDVAQRELTVAMAEDERARLDLSQAKVYSPLDGQVVKIQAYPGEEAGPRGLLELGRTDPMYVVAEVYESDISRVRQGENATVTSDLFPGTLSGAVDNIGTTISKASILPGDPVAFADARVFQVRIRLDNGERVAGLIHGKVNVVIRP